VAASQVVWAGGRVAAGESKRSRRVAGRAAVCEKRSPVVACEKRRVAV
jgi:hypothetical protein